MTTAEIIKQIAEMQEIITRENDPVTGKRESVEDAILLVARSLDFLRGELEREGITKEALPAGRSRLHAALEVFPKREDKSE